MNPLLETALGKLRVPAQRSALVKQVWERERRIVELGALDLECHRLRQEGQRTEARRLGERIERYERRLTLP